MSLTIIPSLIEACVIAGLEAVLVMTLMKEVFDWVG